MSVDQMRTFFLISGITNTTLRNKLIEMQNPTYEEACSKVNSWTATSSASKAIEKVQGTEGKAKAVKGKDQKGQKRIEPPASIKIRPGSLSGKCFCCGSSAHSKRECDRAEKSRCTECKQNGHYKNVCLAEYKTWRNKTFNIQPKDRKGKGKAKKVEATEEIRSAPPSEDKEDSSNE